MARPLYTSFAWAYDIVVPEPAGLGPEAATRLLAGRRFVVDAGCGTGRHAAGLAAAGFRVVGIDTSAQMLDVARARDSAAEFEVADLRTWLPPGAADGVLCRGVLNDFVADDDRQAAVDNLARMLRPLGVLVLDVRELARTRERVAHDPVVSRSGEGVHFRADRRFEDDVLVVHEAISSSDSRAESEFRMRPWTMTEVQTRLRDAGFNRIESRADGDRIVLAATLGPRAGA